ncbi:hypothetical protein ACH5RR_030122 [Cinchona calisaya]|uniref:Uncharacterized protein n=1 Tax=Cinchona calisaya TaxID=153742 RepID=A0ABD2YV41_9GENT
MECFDVDRMCLNVHGNSILVGPIDVKYVFGLNSEGLKSKSKYVIENLVNGTRRRRERNAGSIDGCILFLKIFYSENFSSDSLQVTPTKKPMEVVGKYPQRFKDGKKDIEARLAE